MIYVIKPLIRRITQTFLYAALLSLSACAAHDAGSDDPFIMQHELHSDILTGYRVFSVQLPESYVENTDRAYPVLYHLSSDPEAIELTNDIVSELAEDQRIPELIIVSLHQSGKNRDDIRPSIEGSRRNGNAEPYLEFLEKDVIPFLASNYRASDERIITGWSRYGSFATFASTHKPQLFDGVIVRSSAGQVPSEFLLSRMQDMLVQTPDVSMSFHMSIGTEGNETRRRGSFNALRTVLQDTTRSSLRWKAEVIDAAGHSDTFQPGLRRGLIFHFQGQE